MFTGLIREVANIIEFKDNKLQVEAKYKPKIGDSIAINGACLTVVKLYDNGFYVELSPESKNILAIENYTKEVHIEPAMVVGDRFEGHIVQGHIDCIGTIANIKNNGNSVDFHIQVDKEFIKYIIPKGSIAIDGISLTINSVSKDSFRLTIIPHTIKNTLFRSYKVGHRVNIETDMFARYVYNIFRDKTQISWNDVDRIMYQYS